MVLLYVNDGVNGVAQRLEMTVGHVVPKGNLQTCHGLEDFSKRLLRRPWEGLKIAVIAVMNHEDLQEFISLRELLNGLSIILILPIGESSRVSKWHCLYPRYVTHADSDFKDVAAVLEKLLKNLEKEKY